MFKGSKQVISDEKKIDELLSRGVAEALPSHDSLKKLLMSGERLRIKLGVDPTGERLHLGHSVPLLKLRDFQELGHTIVFIVGDFTAVIGDTSDKESERPMLSQGDIKKNMVTWKSQVGKILDLSKTEFRRNSEWLGKLTYREIGEHADLFSVADFTARENIKRRLEQGKRVSLREVLYPLMQGYDSVAVKADVELGGSDQRFNLLAGRTLQEHFKQTPQHVLTFSLITDASGKKLSKTGSATAYVSDSPDDLFGKTMSIPDDLTRQYFISMTRVPLGEVEQLLAGHPRDAKLALAHELVRMYHGARLADESKENFLKTFSQKEIPTDAPMCTIQAGQTVADALLAAGVIASKSEFRRLLDAGGVKIAGTEEKLTSNSLEKISTGTTLRLGKHQFVKIIK
ncbi:MAG: tyrosine--tRNA ligase [Patescibacteria group bacterium]